MGLEAKCPDFSSTNTTYINTVLYNAPYLYCANPYAALLYAILFALPLLAHCFEAWRYHKFKLCWPIIMAGAWETLSFGFRVSSTQNQFTTNAFTFPSVILLLLAPLWINAFDYLVFGRMLYYFLPNGKIGFIRARRMSVIFVCLDVVAFLIQVTGGLMTNSTNANTLLLGTHIYTAGIAVQQFFILCFLGLIIYFHVKMSKGEGRQDRYGWKRLIYPLYATLLLITARIIYRLREYATDGGDKTLTTHEAYVYVLDATLMLFCLLIWNIWHPGQVLTGPESEFSPEPPNWFRRFCCCCCAVNRRKGWERKYGQKYGQMKDEAELGLVNQPSPYLKPENPSTYAAVHSREGSQERAVLEPVEEYHHGLQAGGYDTGYPPPSRDPSPMRYAGQ